ncbi:MAG: M50 family metallopeptidase [Desulfitobacteriaceae bacterium]|nr:M50 family metallopeptidase [Desulfitobacteriaceae bacterium]
MEIGKVTGVSIRMHPGFLLLLGVYALFGLLPEAMLAFGLVLGHEIAHLSVAKAYGFRIQSLELFPFGGALTCNDIFEGRKTEETMMALAGPLFNIILLFAGQILRWQGIWTGALSEDFIRFNFLLAVFNLLPILPLDGGRIIRAIFAGVFGFVKTTKALAWAGKIVGLFFILAGIILIKITGLNGNNLVLLAFGGFFWIAGNKEISAARLTFLRQLTRKKEELVRRGLMRSKLITVYQDTPLIRVIEKLTPDSYALIILPDQNFKVAGSLTETEILEGMFREGIDYTVGKLKANDPPK